MDQFLERLRPLADGRTQVPMKEELATLTLSIISKVNRYIQTFSISYSQPHSVNSRHFKLMLYEVKSEKLAAVTEYHLNIGHLT